MKLILASLAFCAVPPLFAQTPTDSTALPYITAGQRMMWVASGIFGPSSLISGVAVSAIRTGLDHPVEYGPHWDGFADRFGLRQSSIAGSRVIEASLGSIWGEDPRYRRAGDDAPFKSRLGHIVKWTFVAQNRDGGVRPAYARYIGLTGGNFLSNEWRARSEATNTQAVERSLLGLVSRMAGNTWREFGPDLMGKLHHHT